jgi:hypothetical protein
MTKHIKGKFVATTWVNSQLLKEFKTICEIKKKDGTELVSIWFKQNKNVIPSSSDWCHGQVNNASLSLMFNNKFYKDFWKKATQLEETRCSLLRYCVEQIVTEHEEKKVAPTDQNLDGCMNFTAALTLLNNEQKVAKKSWGGSRYLQKINGTLAIRCLHQTKSYGYNNFNEMLCNDWLIYEETKPYKLEEVLTAFNEGKTIARIGSDNSFDGSNMDRQLSLRDVVANDWIIL